ncbi:MAG: hypothetical protein KatS3mg015_2829 [Fimbriimonadales bacterium]|nr:MAG: hypothetical protein KatS3mg015_2829 [Fimbriimonadales bacterium]
MLHRHHRKRRSQGGDDSPPNVIEIPDWLHELIHSEPEWAYRNGLLVRSHEDPAEVQITLEEKIFTPKRKRASNREEKRPRSVWSVKVPKDERENGAALLDERIERLRELLCPVLGWQDDVPTYFPLIAALDKAIEAIEIELATEAAAE